MLAWDVCTLSAYAQRLRWARFEEGGGYARGTAWLSWLVEGVFGFVSILHGPPGRFTSCGSTPFLTVPWVLGCYVCFTRAMGSLSALFRVVSALRKKEKVANSSHDCGKRLLLFVSRPSCHYTTLMIILLPLFIW
jgi:hypothetical protein